MLCYLKQVLGAMSAPASASDLTRTWKFSVDLNNGEHGEPLFVLKQALRASREASRAKHRPGQALADGSVRLLEVRVLGSCGRVTRNS
jgi:hypothetical protein